MPFGAVGGYCSVALAFLATKRGLSVTDGAELIALNLAPQVWKFFWAPVADATLTRHKWYLLSAVLCAAGVFATAAVPLGPSTLRLIQILVLVSSVASTFLGFAVEGMIAHLTAPGDRGRVSGWYQAGNLGGTGLGGGLGLWLLTTLAQGWEAGLVLGAALLACSAVLPLVPDIPADELGSSLLSTARGTVAELWKLALSRVGALCALLCFVPIGTGAASYVLAQAEVAAYWGVGANTVALIQGALGGVVSMAGCIVGGYGCARFGGRNAYALYGAIMAAVTLVMSVSPGTPLVYVAGCLAYQFVTGFSYAAFSAFVLEAIGARLAATKYNAFASLSNTPIWYMGLVLAAFEVKWGPRGMLATESAFGVVGVMVFVLAERASRPRTWGAPVPVAAG
jgi:hypothetical protein